MTFLAAEALQELRRASPGLELLAYWRDAAARTQEPARVLLSYCVSGLVQRGWVHPVDKLLEAATETLSETREHVDAAWAELVRSDLVALTPPVAGEPQRIQSLAGLFAARPTGVHYYIDHEHSVHLTGPLAALAAAVALGRAGEVRATCSHDKKTRLVLRCDESGVFARNPETICLFLPAWDGTQAPSLAMAGGGLFADDDALGAWQEQNGDPPGMPVMSMMFPMAVEDLGQQLGKALEATLNHLPDFA